MLRQVEQLSDARAAAAWRTLRPQLGIDVFARPPAVPPSREGGYVALMEACLVVLQGRGGKPAEKPLYQPVIPDLWRVSDALPRIKAVLGEHPEGGDLTLFLPNIPSDAVNRALRARAAVASTLLAGLELAREGGLTIDQASAFELVRCTAGQQKEELAAG